MAYEKDPTEKKDYAIDWTRHLAPGESITTSAWSSTPAGLTHSTPAIVAGITTTWISGGTAGVEHRVTNHVVTNQGREFERSFLVNVVDL